MAVKDLNYNITGQGLLRTYMYPYTLELYEFLKRFKYDLKFHSTKQLGAIQYLLKGAHHTRYEYIFLQWTLIHQLKEQAKGLGLNSNNIGIDNLILPNIEKKPTGGEILQCLSLLTNMGHFPDTFSASKVWLHLLRKNTRGLRTGLKKGLKSADKKILDNIVDNFNIYDIHLVNALFLLERYRKVNGGNEIIDFSKKLIIEYIKGDNEELKKYWQIYKSIRKIAYVLMDSHYAPIPFNLDFSSIMLNLDRHQESLINNSSAFQKALEQMNIVLENSLYLDPNSLLVSNMRSEQILHNFRDIPLNEKLDRVSVVRDLLKPLNEKSDRVSAIFQKHDVLSFPEPDWDTNNVLDITYNEIDYYTSIFPFDLWEFEQKLNESLGSSLCRVSAAYPPSKNNFRLVFALKSNVANSKKITKALDIVKKVIEFNSDLKIKGFKTNNQAEDEFKSTLLKYLLSYSFGTEKEYILDFYFNKNLNGMPLFFGKGCIKVANHIQEYINTVKDELDADQIHELELTRDKIKNLNYRGLILAFLGSTKIRKPNESTVSCEFDGIVYLPYRQKKEFLFVIEAKNKPNGNTEAKTQLKKRLNQHLSSFLDYQLEDLGNKGAYAAITVKSK
ncbi:hypothetical protein [Priestia megaterium]|uniref:hypothetical protein n=1 Tax=Priestia megaterium TaxID=1404 RepID=UPI001C211AB3|nr:hypothetical protein [Priestia megaterium]MBU8852744.1 hypothetical protein [Bacillus sp. FJAT-26377]MCU7738860.1 hypothetical protein [Priestia megaterium]